VVSAQVLNRYVGAIWRVSTRKKRIQRYAYTDRPKNSSREQAMIEMCQCANYSTKLPSRQFKEPIPLIWINDDSSRINALEALNLLLTILCSV